MLDGYLGRHDDEDANAEAERLERDRVLDRLEGEVDRQALIQESQDEAAEQDRLDSQMYGADQAEVEAELNITREQVVDLEDNLQRVAREQWAKHPNNPDRSDV